MSQERTENWITELNYDRRAAGMFMLGFMFISAQLLNPLDRPTGEAMLPAFMHYRTVDMLGGACGAAACKTFWPETSANEQTAFGFGTNVAAETYQIVPWPKGTRLEKWFGGTFDVGDIGAYAIGALAFRSIDAAAKKLYDSGATKPLYKLLHIQDRRV